MIYHGLDTRTEDEEGHLGFRLEQLHRWQWVKVNSVEVVLEERGQVEFEMPVDIQQRYQIDIDYIYIQFKGQI